MAIWKDPTPAPKAAEPVRFEPPAPTPMPAEPVVSQTAPIRTADAAARESVIASDLIIEGKIEGSGHVRIAGKFKGDIKVQGNLSIDQGAKVSGGVSAIRSHWPANWTVISLRPNRSSCCPVARLTATSRPAV